MKPKTVAETAPAALRRRAEETLATTGASGEPELSPEGARETLHELRTHQIELEMQNEELRQAQLELAAARDRFSDLYDFAPVGYATVSAKGMIVAANLPLAEMLGHARRRLINQPLSTFILPADEDVYYLHRRKLPASAGKHEDLKHEDLKHEDCELRLLRKDGTSLWAKIESVPEAAGEGHGVLIRSVISDISARKEAEEQQRQLEAQLVQAHKLEGLGGLARGIAHDFNNLLMIIQLNAEMALDELPASSPIRTYLARADTATKRAVDLVEQILAYAGKGTVKIAALELSALVAEMTSLLKVDIAGSVEVRQNLGSGLPAVNADATQIRQVLMNLTTNAAAAVGEESGSITVTTRVADYGREFFRQAYVDDDLEAGRYVCFDVTDNGRGMDEATQERIFEPFFTTRAEGRGLGLASTLGIVRAHHGAIRVISELGRGTTITVALPAAEPARRPTAAAAARVPDQSVPASVALAPLGSPGGGQTGHAPQRASGMVLVVEDENVLCMTVAKMLRGLGCEVLTAADGHAGVEAFRQHASEIALVLLDLKMPRMGGERALAEIHRIRADAKVVLCSGYSENIVAEMLGAERLYGFLQKPYRMARLRQLVVELMPDEE